jgi:hypothetical protein
VPLTYYAGQRLLATDLDAIVALVPRLIIKASDQVYQSDTTFRNDTELTISLQANSMYVVEFVLAGVGQAVSTGDLKTVWSAPSGATGIKVCHGPAVSSTSRTDTTMTSASTPFSTAAGYGTASTTSAVAIREFGQVTTTNAGTLTLQHAQNVSNANDTGILAGSILVVTKVA